MIDRLLDKIPETWLNFFVKIILVALIAMSVKIAILVKKGKISILNILLSFIIGVGFAAITGTLVLESFKPHWVPIVIGAITLIGEKVGNWIIYKLNVDAMMQDFVEYLTRKYKK